MGQGREKFCKGVREVQKTAVLLAVIAVVGLAIFHAVHYLVYCRYKSDPEKSHCAGCGHRKICERHHRKAGGTD